MTTEQWLCILIVGMAFAFTVGACIGHLTPPITKD